MRSARRTARTLPSHLLIGCPPRSPAWATPLHLPPSRGYAAIHLPLLRRWRQTHRRLASLSAKHWGRWIACKARETEGAHAHRSHDHLPPLAGEVPEGGWGRATRAVRETRPQRLAASPRSTSPASGGRARSRTSRPRDWGITSRVPQHIQRPTRPRWGTDVNTPSPPSGPMRL